MARLTLQRSAIVALLAFAAACRGGADDPAHPYARKVAEDIPLIEKAVGVKFKRQPTLQLRSRDEVRHFLLAELDDSTARRDLAGRESAYKAFGLIPPTLDLRKLLLDLYSEQIVGYYDPRTKVLYVVREAPEEYVGITIMHELVHALQDQYVNLDSILRQTGDDDRAAAAQAVIEGEATYEQMIAMVGGGANVAARTAGGWDRIRETIRENLTAQPVMASAPMVIQEEMLFPYINGAEFVRRFKEHARTGLPLADMPHSTEQVLHDSAFFGAHRDEPVRVTLPPLRDVSFTNTLGEFDTRLFLFAHVSDAGVASRAAAGWSGDRYAIVRAGEGAAVVWATAWDTALDAAEFVDALTQAVRFRYADPPRVDGAGGVRSFRNATRAITITPREIAGRNVVLYVDAPAGAPLAVDASRIAVSR